MSWWMSAEQAAVASMHQHDHRGVGAREVAGVAVGVGAAPLVAGLAGAGRAAADAAEAMARVPVEDASGIGQHAAVGMAQRRADPAQVEEVAEIGDARQGQRVLQLRQVDREVREETGVVVDEVRYHSSQPWPFPSSIMLGFHARAVTDEVVVDTNELESAAWFERDWILNHAADDDFRLPRPDSIARRLVEQWLKGEVPA